MVAWGQGKRIAAKKHSGNSWGEENVVIQIYQNSPNCSLKMRALR